MSELRKFEINPNDLKHERDKVHKPIGASVFFC